MFNTTCTHVHDKRESMSMFIHRSKPPFSHAQKHIPTFIYTHISSRACHHTHMSSRAHIHAHVTCNNFLTCSQQMCQYRHINRSVISRWVTPSALLYSTPLYSTPCVFPSYPIPPYAVIIMTPASHLTSLFLPHYLLIPLCASACLTHLFPLYSDLI